jgi:hypothetical protein
MLSAVLAAGERIYFVNPGEVVDDAYYVRSISHEAITLVFTPLGIDHYLALRDDSYFAGAGPIRMMAEERAPVIGATPALMSSSFPPGSPLARR